MIIKVLFLDRFIYKLNFTTILYKNAKNLFICPRGEKPSPLGEDLVCKKGIKSTLDCIAGKVEKNL